MRRPPPAPAWAQTLRTVGVTGTNGKTSTTRLCAAALGALAKPVANVTTLGCALDAETLDVPFNYDGFIATMDRCRKAGGSLAAIELTSEALALGFANAWPCRVGVFTNLTRDHLDAHGSAEHYLASKAQLFNHLPPDGTAVLNARDAAAALLVQVVPAGVHHLRYAVTGRGDAWGEPHVDADAIELSVDGTRATLQVRASGPFEAALATLPAHLAIRAIGAVFIENAIAALLGAIAMGVPAVAALEAIEGAPPPAGRFQVIGRDPLVVVDYAHSPDAMARTMSSARALCEGAVWVVFGAGGNRDQAKRPQMGEAASTADRIMLTSDNPRDEDPSAIADAIQAGIQPGPRVERNLDRARAIEMAIAEADRRDVVVLAGKGHERTQTDRQGQRQLSDVDVARAALERRDGAILTPA